MKFIWIDTETTGIDVNNSAAFQIAMILVDEGKVLNSRCYFLNPLSETIKYHEAAGKIHGYTEQQIKSFPEEKVVVEQMVQYLRYAQKTRSKPENKEEKLIAAGYNVGFDIKHLKALLERNGYKFEDYFSDIVADVFLQVKRARIGKALSYLPDYKLTTVTKSLGIELNIAHDAMADIKATREVALKLYRRGISLI